MYRFQVHLLGTNSALPIHGRYPTSQVLYFGNQVFLIDAGEGTQMRLTRYKINRNKINHIFISHLHGDHCYGLPGLLGSYSHFGRTRKLTVYGPPQIKLFLETVFSISESRIGFPLEIKELHVDSLRPIKINDTNTITPFAMKHRIPTIGFRFDFKPNARNIDRHAITHHKLTIPEIKSLITGQNVRNGSAMIKWEEVTFQKYSPKSYAYCSDTIYDPDLVEYIRGVNLLYHETTYLDDLENEASQRMHSTLGQAIKIGKMAQVGSLLTGHYSSRYARLDQFEERARNTSYPVFIGKDGSIYDL